MFEGPEGSGKSTQARLVVEGLGRLGLRVTHTREPGGTPLGDQLRQLLLLRDDLALEPRAEALMMCAARAQLVERVIRPALARGETVVCDRFGDSTLAYQGYGRGLDVAALRTAVGFATGGLRPDLVVLLDVPVADGLARKRGQDAAAGATAWNRFEAAGAGFHERVRHGYHALAATEPRRWLCLDGLRRPEELAEMIWERVADMVGPP